MRKKIVAGNWKMNLSKAEALALFTAVEQAYSGENTLCIVFPPAIYLDCL
jgi:triosephosphate isomerase